jgi:tetratricopeptide (TPR) repeat protein
VLSCSFTPLRSCLIVALLTFLCFLNAISNDFTNWDDPVYVMDNDLIRGLSFTHIQGMFSSFLLGHYHPLTVLSLALDYALYGLSPGGFHLTNVILHVCNVALVCVFIRRLVGDHLVAILTALFFGVHPMHVESVAWVTERKDILYTFFYLSSLCAYLQFVEASGWKKRWFGASFFLFVCALLSKGQAVTLPVAFLLVDYVRGRRWGVDLILEKVPFLALSVVFGVVAIVGQKDAGAIPDIPAFPLPERILLAFGVICLYIGKIVAPIKLSAFYPYPSVGGSFPYLVTLIAAMGVLGVLTLNALGIASWVGSSLEGKGGVRRFPRSEHSLGLGRTLEALAMNRIVVFSCLFFLVNIALVLQVLPVGGSMICERYTYLSSMGLFLLVAYGCARLWHSARADSRRWRPLVALALIVYTGWLGYATVQRNTVWRNSESLWSDVLQQFPNVPLAYLNRGSYYHTGGQPERALADYNAGLALNPDYTDIHLNRCDVLRILGDYDRSLADCTRVIEKAKDTAAAYTSRGITYSMIGRLDEALSDFERAIALEPKNPKSYSNRGNVYDMSGRYDAAIENYSHAIALSPDYHAAYYNRGKTKIRKGDCNAAIQDLGVSVRSPDLGADSYFYRSQCYRLTGNYEKALEDADTAKRLGRAVDPGYMQSLREGR